VKKILIAVAVVAVLAVVVFMNVKRARERGIEVQVVEIGRRDLVEKVSGSGRVEARRSVSTTSGVVGKVLELAVEEGDTVAAGDLILRIDPGERSALMDQARARLGRARAREELSRAEARQADFRLNRAKGLIEGNLASDRELEEAETGRDVAQANVSAARSDVKDAEAGLAHAQYELDRTVIRAEIPGVVVRLTVEEGENVLAGDLYNSGSSIVTIADLSEMEAHVLVDETEVVKLRRGQEAVVTVDAFPDRELPGRVVEVGNSAYNAGALGSQEAKDFRVRVRLEEIPESLRPGLSARAEVVTGRRDGALAVPIEALVVRDPAKEARLAERKARRGGRARDRDEDDAEGDGTNESKEVEGVFVDRDGHAEYVAVRVGIAGEKHFEVLEGLAEGDRVIRAPFDALRRLETGDALRVEKKKTKKKPRRGSDADEGGSDEGSGGGDEEEGGSDVEEGT